MQPSLETTAHLPPGVIIRHPDREDLNAIANLIILVDLAERGESDVSLEDVELDWQRPNFSPQEDAWLAIALPEYLTNQETDLGKFTPQPVVRDGILVGYEEATRRDGYHELRGDGYVHPHFRNRGIGTALLRTMENRARQWLPEKPDDNRVVLRNGVSASDPSSLDLHRNEGYHPERYFWLMEIDLGQNPSLPAAWPEGVRVRNCIPGRDDRQIFEAMQEAFQDHWGFVEWDYGWWHARLMEREGFDPSLWFLAMDGQEIAGACLGRLLNGQGWVDQLAVRRSWRQRGLGLALLRQTLLEFKEREIFRVGLTVDASNPTGATRLYEKVGMSTVHQYILFEKELWPGNDSRGGPAGRAGPPG